MELDQVYMYEEVNRMMKKIQETSEHMNNENIRLRAELVEKDACIDALLKACATAGAAAWSR